MNVSLKFHRQNDGSYHMQVSVTNDDDKINHSSSTSFKYIEQMIGETIYYFSCLDVVLNEKGIEEHKEWERRMTLINEAEMGAI